MVHSVHCMMGLDSLPATAGTEMSVEEQVDRLFMVRNDRCVLYCAYMEVRSDYLFKYSGLVLCSHGVQMELSDENCWKLNETNSSDKHIGLGHFLIKTCRFVCSLHTFSVVNC